MVWFDSIHKGEDRDGILSTTGEPETNVADSFDGSGVVAAAVSSTIPQSSLAKPDCYARCNSLDNCC